VAIPPFPMDEFIFFNIIFFQRTKARRENQVITHAQRRQFMETSEVEYAAYVFLVWKVRSKHLSLYELINVCGQMCEKILLYLHFVHPRVTFMRPMIFPFYGFIDYNTLTKTYRHTQNDAELIKSQPKTVVTSPRKIRRRFSQ
jgi:hypothetical protein